MVSVLCKKGLAPRGCVIPISLGRLGSFQLATDLSLLYSSTFFQFPGLFSFKTTLSLSFGHLISAPLVAAVNYVLRAYLCPITPFPQQITNIKMEEAALGVGSSGGHQNAMRR